MRHGAGGANQGTPSTRFVLLTDQPRQVNRANPVQEPRRVTWVLMAANNRPLGRAPGMFASVESCLADTTELVANLDRASSSVAFHESTRSAGSHWSWTVQVGDRLRAVSTFRYQRRLECEGSLRRFLAAAGTAAPGAPAVFRLGERLRADSA